jgi:nitrate/TMAO reductase-like tetraheme cytochrome c subunit
MRTITLLAGLLCCSLAAAQTRNSCVTCHDKQEGAYKTPVAEWQTSIHYRNAILCNDCHGGNARSDDPTIAMDRKKGFVGKPSPTQVPGFCGKCHSAVRDNYVQSAHFLALQAGAGPNCVTCHTAHKQQQVTLDLINPQTCGACHTFDRAARLKETMRSAERSLTSMERRDDALFMEGLDEERETKALFSIRNRTHRLTHTLDISRIRLQLNAIQPDAQRLDAQLTVKEKEVKDRKILGTVLMAFFLVGAAVAWRAHTAIMEPTGSDESS